MTNGANGVTNSCGTTAAVRHSRRDASKRNRRAGDWFFVLMHLLQQQCNAKVKYYLWGDILCSAPPTKYRTKTRQSERRAKIGWRLCMISRPVVSLTIGKAINPCNRVIRNDCKATRHKKTSLFRERAKLRQASKATEPLRGILA